jgi:hypothetical protein
MPTYLFVTKTAYNPESIESDQESWWSCSRTTRTGDRAFVYVTGVGIQYEWRALSDARPHTTWRYICDVDHVRTIDPPITLGEIRDEVPEYAWKPPYQNFRGLRSIIIPDEVVQVIRAIRPPNESGSNEI